LYSTYDPAAFAALWDQHSVRGRGVGLSLKRGVSARNLLLGTLMKPKRNFNDFSRRRRKRFRRGERRFFIDQVRKC